MAAQRDQMVPLHIIRSMDAAGPHAHNLKELLLVAQPHHHARPQEPEVGPLYSGFPLGPWTDPR